MTSQEDFKKLQKYNVRELKKEVAKVKRGFQASKLKRAKVGKVILNNRALLLHLFDDKRVKQNDQKRTRTKKQND